MTDQTINIDLCYLADSQPSLCIPRVFNNISEDRIRRIFDELSLGRISAVDIKERRSEKGESFKRVYIHFEKWFWNENAQTTRKKLISGKEVKIVYDNPWFWKVSASKWAPSRDYEIGTKIHKQLQVHILDDYQIIDEFDRELSSHKLSRKEYDEHYKRICEAKERFYNARELNYNTKKCNDTRERRNDDRRDYDRRDYDRRDYDRRDYDRSDYDRRDYDRRDYDRRDYDRRDYDRRDTRERGNDNRSHTRQRDYDRRSDSRERRNDNRRSDSRDRDRNNIEIAPTLNVTPSVPLTNQIIPTKRFKLQVKKKTEPLKTKINAVSLEIKKEKVLEKEEIEEGEIEETELNVMTEEKKQILEDLYGDI